MLDLRKILPSNFKLNIQQFAEQLEKVNTKTDDFSKYVDNAISDKNSKNNKYLGTTSNFVSSKVKEFLNIDITNRNQIITSDNIRHMLKEHGNPATESKKGQISITKEDIKKIPSIIRKPDDIIKGTSNKDGPTIRYIKKYTDNTTYVVEVIPDNLNKSLQIKTMWKKPITELNTNSPKPTSRNVSNSLTSTSVNNIPQKDQNINENLGKIVENSIDKEKISC